MATLEAVREESPQGADNALAAWARWWRSGTPLDWGFALLASALIGAGYYDAWINRNIAPPPSWEHVPLQLAGLAVTVYLGAASFLAWRRTRDLRSVPPAGYGLSLVGCGIFLVGIVINGWWTVLFGPDFGVPAIFRLPNLLQIAGAGLIVVGPLRASTTRGELLAGPTALVSAVLLLATATFFTQFDHPYINPYAQTGGVLMPSPRSAFDLFNYREEVLGVLGLLMQSAVVIGVILWILRQTKLPVGSITVMMLVTTVLVAAQLGTWGMLIVGAVVGVLGDVALLLARPRADRILGIRLFSVAMALLLSGVYLIYLALGPGTWWPPDMTFGAVAACAIVGGLLSFVVFPDTDAVRAASVLWPALSQDSSPEAPDVTVERVEHVLKVLHNTRDLAESPLVGMACLAVPSPLELRKTVEGAIEQLRESPFQQDQQAGQILDLYYVRRIGGHYAVTMRVGLSRAAYFNRRSYGVRRLVDRLRELEEATQPA